MSEECTRCQVVDLNFYTEFYVPPKHKYINRILLNFDSIEFYWILKVKRRQQIHKYPPNWYISVCIQILKNKIFYIHSGVNVYYSEEQLSVFFLIAILNKICTSHDNQYTHIHKEKLKFQGQLLPYIYIYVFICKIYHSIFYSLLFIVVFISYFKTFSNSLLIDHEPQFPIWKLLS